MNIFQILAQIYLATWILQVTILKSLSKMLNQSLLHSGMLLSVMSLVFYMDLHWTWSNKATGVDRISRKINKLAAPVISDSLTLIFNRAIALSAFPDEWKVARVISLYKSGQRNIPGNYRPISVLPAISKIMERILYDQLYSYLIKFELLSDSQFRFRKFHSIVSALLDCTIEWYVNLDRKMFNLVVLIDLKKAFDTVDHQILLRKLELYAPIVSH